MIIKIGDKQKWVSIPNGYKQVATGTCQADDKFLDMGAFPRVIWRNVEKDDFGDPSDFFTLLIRPENSNDKERL